MSIEVELNRIANALETLVGAKQQPAPSIEGPYMSGPVDTRGPAPKAPKAQKPAAKAPEPVVTPVYTKDQVYQALRQHADDNTAEVTKKLMKKHGATTPKVDEIPVENYPALMEDLKNSSGGIA